MVKKYPWQRWPDKKNKKKSNCHGQTRESSWKKSSIEDVKRKEREESAKPYLKHQAKMRKGGKYARRWVEEHGEG